MVFKEVLLNKTLFKEVLIVKKLKKLFFDLDFFLKNMTKLY